MHHDGVVIVINQILRRTFVLPGIIEHSKLDLVHLRVIAEENEWRVTAVRFFRIPRYQRNEIEKKPTLIANPDVFFAGNVRFCCLERKTADETECRTRN